LTQIWFFCGFVFSFGNFGPLPDNLCCVSPDLANRYETVVLVPAIPLLYFSLLKYFPPLVPTVKNFFCLFLTNIIDSPNHFNISLPTPHVYCRYLSRDLSPARIFPLPSHNFLNPSTLFVNIDTNVCWLYRRCGRGPLRDGRSTSLPQPRPKPPLPLHPSVQPQPPQELPCEVRFHLKSTLAAG